MRGAAGRIGNSFGAEVASWGMSEVFSGGFGITGIGGGGGGDVGDRVLKNGVGADGNIGFKAVGAGGGDGDGGEVESNDRGGAGVSGVGGG